MESRTQTRLQNRGCGTEETLLARRSPAFISNHAQPVPQPSIREHVWSRSGATLWAPHEQFRAPWQTWPDSELAPAHQMRSRRRLRRATSRQTAKAATLETLAMAPAANPGVS